MNSFDWLRLGGMIANRWSEIDFTDVTIEKVSGIGIVRCLIQKEPNIFRFDSSHESPDEATFEYEDVEMKKVIIEGHTLRIGYGPKSKRLMINSSSSGE